MRSKFVLAILICLHAVGSAVTSQVVKCSGCMQIAGSHWKYCRYCGVKLGPSADLSYILLAGVKEQFSSGSEWSAWHGTSSSRERPFSGTAYWAFPGGNVPDSGLFERSKVYKLEGVFDRFEALLGVGDDLIQIEGTNQRFEWSICYFTLAVNGEAVKTYKLKHDQGPISVSIDLPKEGTLSLHLHGGLLINPRFHIRPDAERADLSKFQQVRSIVPVYVMDAVVALDRLSLVWTNRARSKLAGQSGVLTVGGKLEEGHVIWSRFGESATMFNLDGRERILELKVGVPDKNRPNWLSDKGESKGSLGVSVDGQPISIVNMKRGEAVKKLIVELGSAAAFVIKLKGDIVLIDAKVSAIESVPRVAPT